MENRIGYIRAIYHDGTHIQGRILSSRQKWRGNGYPTTTEYTIKPYNPVMGETTIREALLIDEAMLTHDINWQKNAPQDNTETGDTAHNS
jgi:hypothetical protein